MTPARAMPSNLMVLWVDVTSWGLHCRTSSRTLHAVFKTFLQQALRTKPPREFQISSAEQWCLIDAWCWPGDCYHKYKAGRKPTTDKLNQTPTNAAFLNAGISLAIQKSFLRLMETVMRYLEHTMCHCTIAIMNSAETSRGKIIQDCFEFKDVLILKVTSTLCSLHHVFS